MGIEFWIMREGAAAEQNLTAMDAAAWRRTEEDERCGFSSSLVFGGD